MTDQQIFDYIGDLIHDSMHYPITDDEVRSTAFIIYEALFRLPLSLRQDELFLEAFIVAITYELKNDLFEYQINRFIDETLEPDEFPVLDRTRLIVAEELRLVRYYDFDVHEYGEVDPDRLVALIVEKLSDTFSERHIVMDFDELVEIGVHIFETISENAGMIDFEKIELVNQIIRVGALSSVVEFLTMQFLMTGFQLIEYSITLQNDTGYEIREIQIIATYVDEVDLIVYDDLVSLKNGESIDIEIAEPREVDAVYSILLRPVIEVTEGAHMLGGGILFYKQHITLEPDITVVFTRDDIVH
jgi:hypothetical protein